MFQKFLGGKTAIVTGSNSGIGLGIAHRLAMAGADIVLNSFTDRDEDHALAKTLARDHGVSVRYVKADMSKGSECRALIEQVGRCDILVNNAGIQFRRPMLELDSADWRRVIDINLTSAFVIGREAARRMVRRGRGKIINIGSVNSHMARATIAPYTAAKGGIVMLTKAMAAEWGERGIQANAIGPGYMVTEMNRALLDNPDFDSWVKARTPMRRWGSPKELAGTVIYLASEASSYVSGQIIYADGGMTSVL